MLLDVFDWVQIRGVRRLSKYWNSIILEPFGRRAYCMNRSIVLHENKYQLEAVLEQNIVVFIH